MAKSRKTDASEKKTDQEDGKPHISETDPEDAERSVPSGPAADTDDREDEQASDSRDAATGPEDGDAPADDTPFGGDAPVADPDSPASTAPDDATEADTEDDADKSAETTDEAEPDSHVTQGPFVPPVEPAPEPAPEPGPEPEPEPESAPDPAASADPVPSVVHHEEIRKGGTGAMILGGVIAAALGFGAAQYANGGWPFERAADPDPFQDEMRGALKAQDAALADLRAGLESTLGPADLEPLQGTLADQSGTLETLQADLGELRSGLADLAARIDEIEKRPIRETVSPEAIAAYERELANLQSAMAEQRKEIENIAAEAVEKEQNADEAARQTMARSAATRIVTALESGDAFVAAIDDLARTGTDVPEVLRSVAAEGVPTRAALIAAFPGPARRALAAARADAASADDPGSRLGNFLRNQLGARSVVPRDGNDPDAVLSRAEAALRDGRLADALAEIETLPEPAQAELSAWTQQASLRRDALAAADSLVQNLNQ